MFGLPDPKEWITDLFKALGEMLSDAYTGLIVLIVKLLATSAFPSTEVITSEFFQVGLGGFFGLARLILIPLIILVAIYVIFTPLRDHSKEISRTATTFVALIAFAYLFYPAIALARSFSEGLTQSAINLASSDSSASIEQVNEFLVVTWPTHALGYLITAFWAAVFALIAMVESFMMQVMLLMLVVSYPLIIALRMLGGPLNVVFHFYNTSLAVILISPPLMMLGFLLPLIVQDKLPWGDLPAVSAFATIVGGLFAVVVPPGLGLLFFRASRQVFGNIESKISGKADIGSMPPVSLEEAHNDVHDQHQIPLRNVAPAPSDTDGVKADNLYRDAAKLVVAKVHPAAAAAVTAVEVVQTVRDAPDPGKPNNSEGGER